MPETKERARDHAGHRSRVKHRVRASGISGMLDYEVLEYALFFALARGATQAMVKKLAAIAEQGRRV